MDFEGRIARAQNEVNTSKNTYNQYQQQADQAGNRFNQGLNKYQSRSFGDIYNQARGQYYNTPEMQKAQGAYQEARDAVNQMNTTINKLPETIRQQFGGTAMTAAQRERALGDQRAAMGNTLNLLNTNYQTASDDYNRLSDRGLKEAMFAAQGNDSREWNVVNALQNAWNTLLGQRNTAYSQNQQDRGLLADQYGARDKWQLAQDQMALERWKEQQANARAAAQRANDFAIQKYLANSNERIAGLNRPTNNGGGGYNAPRSSGGNSRPSGSAMRNAWNSANLFNKIFSTPGMLLNGDFWRQ